MLTLHGFLAAVSAEVLSLDEALEQAIAANPNLEAARQRVAQAQAHLEEARSANLPLVDAGLGAMRTDSPLGAFGALLRQRAIEPGIDFNRPGTVSHGNAYLETRYSLYSGGFRASEIAERRARRFASEASLQAFSADLASAVAIAYREAQKARAVLSAIDASLASMEEAVSLARKREEAGALLMAERLALEVEHAQLREGRLRSAHAAELAQLALGKLLDRASVEVEPLPMLGPVPAALAIGQAFDAERLPEYSAAQLRFEAVEAQARQANAGRLPRVDTFARGDWDSGLSDGGIERSWTVGVAASVNLWDGKANRSRELAAVARVAEARAGLRALERDLRFRYDSAARERETAGHRLEVAKLSVALAEEQTRLAKERFAAGSYLATQLNEAERALLSARSRASAALADALIADAKLERAMGMKANDDE